MNSTIAGERVYVLTLKYRGQQVLRVQGNTYTEALAAMQSAIPASGFALWEQSQVQGSIYEQFLGLNDEHNRLAQYITSQYTWELERTPALKTLSIYDLAVLYLGRERSRLWVRALKLFRRGRQRPQGA